MKISDIYIGGWFQRTMLQLTEVYDFLRNGESKLNLDKERLLEFRKNLEIGKVEYGVKGEEYIKFTTAQNITVTIFEDGLITLKNHTVSEDTLSYIGYLWDMTKNYVNSAQKLFNGLKSDVTSKSVNNLTIVTSMSAGASIISLLTNKTPTFTLFSVLYFFILALLGWTITKTLKTISKNRKYEVSDIEYDKDIK